MRALIFLPNLESGGAENVLINISNHLSKSDIDFTLLVGERKGAFSTRLDREVKVIEIGSQSVFTNALRIFSIVTKIKPHAILVSKIHVNILFALFSIFMKGTRIYLREANTPSAEAKYASKSHKLIYCLAKFTYPLAHKIVAVSYGVEEDVIEFYKLNKTKVVTLYNPIINDLDVAKFPDRSVLNSNIYRFIVIGRVYPQKDYVTLIEACKLVSERKYKFKVHIYGRYYEYDEYYKTLSRLIMEYNLGEVVCFKGFTNAPSDTLKDYHGYIQTSRFEGLPGSLIEALNSGVDIVATDCKSGVAEVLNDGQYGELVKVGDYVALADSMIFYLDGNIKERADKAFLNRFSFSTCLTQYENLIKS